MHSILPYLATCTATGERRASRGGRRAANSCSLVEDRDADATEPNLTVPQYRTRRCSRVTRVPIDLYARTRIIRLVGDLRRELYTRNTRALVDVTGSISLGILKVRLSRIENKEQQVPSRKRFDGFYLVTRTKQIFVSTCCVPLRDFFNDWLRISASPEHVMGQNWL